MNLLNYKVLSSSMSYVPKKYCIFIVVYNNCYTVKMEVNMFYTLH